ncbi:hypothetical protein [Mesobacillus selenatarsenatis]|uniref:Uncharacterized protein n=1 Tax=Mesobacillus selenatarsenatis (strain DSM 18680 / JCM 14380 / FERM P-15431 / SF-1) TaxID=1321606 RepID=A0A0A8X011_MESS1|nr:hypothetical protein [Mesobacillus selenatarsenatis]GAM12337.1 hypothetical protein SAMD00020551_0469 [Mesobacillus selenatarsenatis SF-1]
MLKIKNLVMILICVILIDSSASVTSAVSTTETASVNAYNWLKGQQCTTGLIDSFSDSQQISYTYDQAVGAIAFLLKGDHAGAKAVLDSLKSLQTPSGSWYTAYYCNNKSVQEYNQHVGPVLWVVMAVAKYEKDTGDTVTYRNMALKAIDWSLQFQQADGGINGGLDTADNVITWASTEHNQDAYAMLKHYGYTQEAAAVKSFLDDQVWQDTEGYFWAGRNDPNNPMDTNAWGVQALGTTGIYQYNRGLDYVMNTHRNLQTKRVKSSSITIDGFDFDSDKDDVWFEGQGQMVVSFKMDGRTADANYFLNEIIKIQDFYGTGGVPYSLLGTNNGYWTMKSVESVSATGWLIYAIDGYNPFQP